MNTLTMDVAVIGSGTAGLNARREVERRGGRPVMIESGPYGTTCARVGCMPSKLLVAAATAAHDVEHAPHFGVHPETMRIDGRTVVAGETIELERGTHAIRTDGCRLRLEAPEVEHLLNPAYREAGALFW